jgi:hypothetical protein
MTKQKDFAIKLLEEIEQDLKRQKANVKQISHIDDVMQEVIR